MTWQVQIAATVGAFHLDVDLSGETGPIVLIGPNGSGKTTLLRAIAGGITGARGRIQIDETVLLDTEAGLNLACEQRRLGYVPQGYGLFPHLSVLDNVAFSMCTGPNRRPRAERNEAAEAMLRQIDCHQLAHRRPHRLSGGEQQKVALARALMVAPRMMLLDEPLAALDAAARRKIRRFLKERLQSLPCPSIVVTHDVRDVVALQAPIFVLEAGRVIQNGLLDELRQAPANEFVEEFVSVEG